MLLLTNLKTSAYPTGLSRGMNSPGGAVHEKATYYRELAERCRKLAEDIPDAEAKALMLDVARQYAWADGSSGLN